MIDYKLILILVLSIVLLYLYNKVDSLKNDLIKINKSYKEELKKLELLLISKNNLINSNINTNFCKLPINSPKNDDVLKDEKNKNLEGEILNFVKEKNTTDFSATESESDLSTSENFVIYSNEKISELEVNEINLVKKYENLEDLKESNSLAELCDENLSKSLSDKYLDSIVNSHENNEIDDVINIENLIDKLGEENLVFDGELCISDIKLNNLPSSYLEIIDSSNSNNEDENVKALSDSNIEILKSGSLSINSDLDYELSENNKDDINNENFTLNTEIQLDNFNTYKLYDLQILAKENNLTTTKLQNGKVKNKTKKELYNELNKINLK